MFISLIGMSGVGKSFWSSKLEKEKGFRRFGCDDLIESELSPMLKKTGGTLTNDLCEWMGQPFDERFEKNCQIYLELEAKFTGLALDAVENSKSPETDNIVIDTTGSVIYLSDELQKRMKRLTKVVYFNTPEEVIERKIRQYFEDPKPIIWGDKYCPAPGEDKIEALKRCYPDLLKYRTGLYEKLADVTIDYYRQMEKSYTVENLLQDLRAHDIV